LLNAFDAVVPTYFDQSQPYTAILDGGTTNGFKANDFNVVNGVRTGPNSVKGWYGTTRGDIEAFGGVKKLFVIYNSFNGSGAGVSQILAKALATNPRLVPGSATTTALAGIPEANIVTVGPTGASTPNCFAYDQTPLTSASTTVRIEGATADLNKTYRNQIVCTSNAVTEADLAVSDADVPELLEIYKSVAKAPLTAITRKPVFMQGYGVAVNNNFYSALQNAQILAGKLPGCVTGTPSTATYSELCQPNVSRAQYASLASKSGNLKSSRGFIPGDATFLTLARRGQTSGTQAAS
jgi:hypothetical protein